MENALAVGMRQRLGHLEADPGDGAGVRGHPADRPSARRRSRVPPRPGLVPAEDRTIR